LKKSKKSNSDLQMSPTAANPSRSPSLVSALCLSVTLLAGALQLWLRRYQIGTDGVSYRDMAAGVLEGRWSSLLNGCWSPGYPAILALGMKLIPNEQWAVKAVNYLLFVCATLCLMYLFKRLRLATSSLVLCCTWWIFTSVSLMGVYSESPDFAVASIVFLAAALLIEAIRDEVHHPLRFGAVIALGFLIKAAFLPIALLALAFLFWKNWRLGAISAASLIVLAAPYVIGLSNYKGRPTIGDNGWFNWASHVQRIPVPIWHGDQVNGLPRHPIQQISSNPEIDIFREPFTRATYPPHYDPTYWAEGVRMRYSLALLFKSIRTNVPAYAAVFIQKVPIALALLFCFMALIGRFRLNQASILLLALGSAGTLLFLPIHMEVRYIGAYLTLIVAGSVSALAVKQRYTSVAALILAIIVAYQLDISLVRLHTPEDTNIRFAQDLSRAGLRSGDEIAVVGDAYRSVWARTLKLHIVAQIPDPNVLREDKARLTSLAAQVQNDLGVAAVIGQMDDTMSILSIAPATSRDSHDSLTLVSHR
jgi:hypothetical protein